MDAILASIPLPSVDQPTVLLSVFVFVSAAMLAFGIMGTVRIRGDVRRRAAKVAIDPADLSEGSRSLRSASVKATHRLLDYANRYFPAAGARETPKLRKRLIQAGFLDPRAGAIFFVARVGLAAVLAIAAFIVMPVLAAGRVQMLWPLVWIAGIAGYLGPKIYIDRRIARRRAEYRTGFPDFMDLLVVCADAGLSMEAALDRVGRELSSSYPALSSNIYMTTLEIRAGHRLSEALHNFAERLGLEEARAFATLLQQSEELGSSLTEALRVYSDDMRHKRMSLAEEKAYSLPAKLSVPLILCIFPVILIVILLPVYVRVKFGVY